MRQLGIVVGIRWMQSHDDIVESFSLKTQSFEELSDAVVNWDQEYDQLSGGQFEGGLKLAQVNESQILRIRWGQKIRYRGTAPAGAFAFALPFDQQGDANWIGQKAGVDTVLMQAPNKAGDLISSNFYDALVLGVPENDVFRISSALSGKGEISGNLHGASTLSTAGAASLRHQGQSLIDRAISDFSDDRAALKRLSDQFIKLFLWELVKSNGGGLKEHRVSRPARLVGDATDLVLSDVTGNIGLTTLCAHYGVSLRTLHYAFKDVTGLSAATWLRRMRLNRVHRELQGAISNGATIGSVAATYGFHHQGHFTNQYKRLFGCLPSETLHRN
ncbi:helix-turn-helix domain-containing protein [Ruegeria sp. HKCCA4633]|uniref:helix-turn-helix domain-containing protein n=2 Tax=Roseobacteraceae TaxID=2854170 RepID=UPI00147F9397|nr:helix-turn-helix domain-containing protein [Ruegeria sp. HKCCA4633]